MLFLFLFLGVGLGFGIGYAPSLERALLFGGVAIVLCLWAKKKRKLLPFLCALLSTVTIGLLLYFLPYPPTEGGFHGVVVRQSENYVIVQRLLWRYYVSAKGNRYELGDVLFLQGKAEPFVTTTYESRFDFGEYLKSLGARMEIIKPKAKAAFENPIRLRAFMERFLSHFEGETRAMLDSLMFGRKDYDAASISLASEMNLLFVLSASGLFYSLYLRGIESLFLRRYPKYADVIALCFGIIVLPFSLQKIGIIRVFLVRLFKVLDVHVFHKEISYLNRLGIAGLILLLDPYNALGSSLWLGVGVSGLMYVSSNYIRVENTLAKKGLGMLLIRLFVMPLSLSSTGTLHPLGALYSLLILPLSAAMVFFGYLGLFTYPIVPLLNWLAETTLGLLQGLSSFDPTIFLPRLSLFGVIAFYVILLLALFLTEVNARKTRLALVCLSIGAYCLSLVPIEPMLTQSVSFINVGQGDCCLIQDGLTTVMIDTGGNIAFDMAEEALIPYLRKRRIYHLDALIASHQDYDHVGGVKGLQEKFMVRRYVTDSKDFPLRIGDLTFLNYNDYGETEENDKSLVLSLDFMDQSWVFTGDAPIFIERRIIKDYPTLDCDVLKVGHHGSDTSTCDEFLDALTPHTAVISCGAKNKFGHPTPVVLSRLKKRGITIRRTDLEGTITFRRLRR